MKTLFADRRFIALEEVRSRLGRDAMYKFMASHSELGFEYCDLCNYYVRDYDSTNKMCEQCKEQVVSYAGSAR